MEKLALFGGNQTIKESPPAELFKWPIITEEDEAAALEVVRKNKFSGRDITEKFQDEFAAWQGSKYAIAYCNGTMALTSAMFAIGLGAGDEGAGGANLGGTVDKTLGIVYNTIGKTPGSGTG